MEDEDIHIEVEEVILVNLVNHPVPGLGIDKNGVLKLPIYNPETVPADGSIWYDGENFKCSKGGAIHTLLTT
jgi:hypothetical protein